MLLEISQKENSWEAIGPPWVPFEDEHEEPSGLLRGGAGQPLEPVPHALDVGLEVVLCVPSEGRHPRQEGVGKHPHGPNVGVGEGFPLEQHLRGCGEEESKLR